MQLADDNFGIPQILSAHHMSNPDVDELSMMTYLSYFTQDNGIGEKWNLNLVNRWNTNHPVENFNHDWSNGKAVGKNCSFNVFYAGVHSCHCYLITV